MSGRGLPPGPSTPASMQAVLWGLRYPSFTQKAHRRYGRTFTVHIGGLAPSVVTVDRDGIRRLFSGNPLIKRHASDQLKPLFGERSVVVLEPAEHLERRKLLLPSFQGGSVRAYGDEIEKLTEAAIADWSSGQVVKILGFAQRLTLDVILRALLGSGPSEPQVLGRVREIFDSMVGLPGSSIAGYFPRLVRRSRWNLPGERYWRLRDSLDAILIQQVEAARSTPLSTQEHAILPLLIRSRDKNGHGLDDVDLRDELKALITAGHETTATAIAWAAELLAHNPAAQASAREAAMTGDSEYLDAFVKEVLRIRTPVPVSATRRITEPFELGGYTIPPGVPILVNSFGLHHDPVLYPEPETFRADRFIERSPDVYAYLPFGGGARRCIGSALASLEIRIVLMTILKNFGLAPTEDKLASTVRRGITLVPANGARVRLVE
jgi:cytochrome P450 family 135